ncbi:MAG: RCC1 domain-containing protein, partial [Acidimicrobiia bacterium]
MLAAIVILALTTTGCTLWGWGNNLDGQVGDGTSDTRLSPSPAPPIFDDWLSLNTGEFHSCGIRFDKSLWCWGHNAYGQLGADLQNSQALPVRVVGSATWNTVDAGGSFTCAIRAAESLWCWGHN